MKVAQELRNGNVFRQDGELMVVMKTEFTKSGRTASVVKLKYRSLLAGRVKEEVVKADVKFDDVILDRKPCTYSYFNDPMYVFLDDEYNQHEVGAEVMADVLKYLDDGMECELVFYEGRPIAVELPNVIVREIEFTEPSVRGDTVGKVMKPARLKGSGHEIRVSSSCEIGDKIEIDTRTDEFRKRVQA